MREVCGIDLDVADPDRLRFVSSLFLAASPHVPVMMPATSLPRVITSAGFESFSSRSTAT